MNATEIIRILYGMVAFISLVGYLPQIIRLITNEDCAGISAKTWVIGTAISAITLLYSFIVNRSYLSIGINR